MKNIMRARIYCFDVLETIPKCPGWGVITAKFVREVSKNGRKFLEYRIIPEWKCPICGEVQKFSYLEIDGTPDTPLEWLETPVTVSCERDKEFYWLPEHLRELVR